VCNSRVRSRLGSASANSPSSSSVCNQQVRSWAARTSSSQTALRRQGSNGRLASPVALAARTFLAADRPGARRPGGQVQPSGGLGDPGAISPAAVGVGRWHPCRRGQAEDGRADVGVDGQPDREPQPTPVQVPDELAAGPGAVAAHQDPAAAPRPGGELGQRELQDGDVVGRVVGAGVAGAQDAG
jgi:hypothetical protein